MKSKFDPQKHHRRSIRFKGYDYASEGAYYVTIVAHGRECLFGKIVKKEMYLSKYGEIVQNWWDEIPIHFLNVESGPFVIMPNHVHGIIFIIENRRGEVLSPRYNPNQDNQEFAVDEEISHTMNEPMNLGGETRPYAIQHWGKLLHTSNINRQKK